MKPNYYNFSTMTSLLQNPKDSLPQVQNDPKNDHPRANSMVSAQNPRCGTHRRFPTSECTPKNLEDNGDVACPPPHITSYSDKDETAKLRSRPPDSAPAPVVPSSNPSGPSAHHHGLGKRAEIGGALIFVIPPNNHPNNPFVPSDEIGDEKEVAHKGGDHGGKPQNAPQKNFEGRAGEGGVNIFAPPNSPPNQLYFC